MEKGSSRALAKRGRVAARAAAEAVGRSLLLEGVWRKDSRPIPSWSLRGRDTQDNRVAHDVHRRVSRPALGIAVHALSLYEAAADSGALHPVRDVLLGYGDSLLTNGSMMALFAGLGAAALVRLQTTPTGRALADRFEAYSPRESSSAPIQLPAPTEAPAPAEEPVTLERGVGIPIEHLAKAEPVLAQLLLDFGYVDPMALTVRLEQATAFALVVCPERSEALLAATSSVPQSSPMPELTLERVHRQSPHLADFLARQGAFTRDFKVDYRAAGQAIALAGLERDLLLGDLIQLMVGEPDPT